MVNHVRTLLLNKSAFAVAKVSDIYVPSDFQSIIVPAWLQPLQYAIIPYALSVEDQVSLVDNLLPLLHCGELQAYTLRFDSRVTYTSQPLAQVAELLTTAPVPAAASLTAIATRMSLFPTLGVASKAVFNFPAYSSDETDLAALWVSAEGTLRIGAMVLGYAYQLERIRQGVS